jgi:hypothetical protein
MCHVASNDWMKIGCKVWGGCLTQGTLRNRGGATEKRIRGGRIPPGSCCDKHVCGLCGPCGHHGYHLDPRLCASRMSKGFTFLSCNGNARVEDAAGQGTCAATL